MLATLARNDHDAFSGRDEINSFSERYLNY